MTYRVTVQISGGGASYVAAKLALEEYGHDDVALVFADTRIEDQDLYRFLDDCERRLNHPIIRIAEGRDPWQVFFDEKMMGNSKVDPCSRILKREMLDRWRRDNATADCVIIIGFDANEQHRLDRLSAHMPNVRAPLIERGIWREQIRQIVEADGLRMPRLYDLRFPHNNCGGFCVKGGFGNFALLLTHFPKRYAEHEAREEAFRAMVGKDVSIMRDRSGADSKPLTMKAFRERHQRQPTLTDMFDLGGCSCMEEPHASLPELV